MITFIDIFTAWRVQPRNYLLFACHAANATAQSVQDVRFVKYWHFGGRESKYEPTSGDVKGPVSEAIEAARQDSKIASETK